MSMLIHLVYCSTASCELSDQELTEILEKARINNANEDITGILLYTNRSFFQILEGTQSKVDQLFSKITADQRHFNVVSIIKEPIAGRDFGNWTMGFAKINAQEVDEIIGLNDFFSSGACFKQLDNGRTKKLLSAFKEGRWRSKIHSHSSTTSSKNTTRMQTATAKVPQITFAYQPIISTLCENIIAYEAFPHHLEQQNTTAEALCLTDPEKRLYFDLETSALAICLAARLGLACNLHLNFLAKYFDIDKNQAAIQSLLETAKRNQIEPHKIVLEIDQEKLPDDSSRFGKIIDEYRGAGLKIALNHFGAGSAGLNLLEPYQPELISLNKHLVRGIESNGPRQAILRGLIQTCQDLGIDIIAKHIRNVAEFEWLKTEGIYLFQGDLFAKQSIEHLPAAILPVK